MGVIKSLFKVTVLGGTLYATAESGLWKGQEETIEKYKNYRKVVSDFLAENQTIQTYVPDLKPYTEKVPSLDISKEDAVEYWNSGVRQSFAFLASLPTYSQEGFWKGYEYAKEFLKSQNIIKK